MPHPDPEARTTLRRQMRALLAAIDPADLARRSQAAADNLIAARYLERIQQGNGAIMLFAPLLRSDGSREIETLPIAQEAWRRGVTVTLPRTDWAARRLIPTVVHNYDTDLVQAPPPAHGLMEPRPDLPAFPAAKLDIIVVPGLAFDRSGHRLGHGAGFYDRFLAALAPRPASGPRSALFLGLALGRQVVESLPRAPHDVPMDVVVTELEISYHPPATGSRP